MHPKTIVRYAVELTPYAIFDMDGTLLCSTGMWDHVTDRILAKYGKTITVSYTHLTLPTNREV